MRLFRLVLLCLLIVVLPAFALHAQDDVNPALASVYAYIADNPDQVGIACYPLNDPEAGVYHNADERFPLASTVKTLLLLAYAEQVAAGVWAADEVIALSELEAYYVPNTDGGAYPAWIESIGAEDTVTLDQIVRGMIMFSTNNGADYLFNRLSDYDWADLFRRIGVENSDAPMLILGLFLALENPETGLANPQTMTDEEQAERSADMAQRYLDDPDFRAAAQARVGVIPYSALAQTAYFARFGSFGTPRDYTRVMQAAFTGEGLIPGAAEIARPALEWALMFPEMQAQFSAFGTKGGSLAGILTSAYFAQEHDGEPIMLAVFYQGIPLLEYVNWLSDFRMQGVELEAIISQCANLAAALP